MSGMGRYPGEENGNPLQYSCLENFTDRGTWWDIVHRVPKSQTGLSATTPPQIGWNQKPDDADFQWSHHQPIRRMSISWSWPAAWTNTIKPLVGHTVSRALACSGPLWLSNKPISTSPKTLSLRFNVSAQRLNFSINIYNLWQQYKTQMKWSSWPVSEISKSYLLCRN